MLLTVDGMWKLPSARWLLGLGSHCRLHPATPQPENPSKTLSGRDTVLHIMGNHFDTFFRIKKLPALNLIEKESVARQGVGWGTPQGIAECSVMKCCILQASDGTDDNTARKHTGADVLGCKVVPQHCTHCEKVFENNQLSHLFCLCFLLMHAQQWFMVKISMEVSTNISCRIIKLSSKEDSFIS